MLWMGDPLNYEGKVFMTLGQLFDDVHHQKLAVGVPCHPDYSKQEEEIVTHLAKLTRDKRNDTVCLPASVPEAKQVLNPSHPGTVMTTVPDIADVTGAVVVIVGWLLKERNRT